jgi:hypothetical protein
MWRRSALVSSSFFSLSASSAPRSASGFHHAAAEDVDGLRHGADLVEAFTARDCNVDVVARQPVHDRCDRNQRTRDAAAQE